jgi:hypothetical protein
MQTITMYQGDLLPKLEVELSDRNNIPLNLTGISAIKLFMGLDPDDPAQNKIDGAELIVTDATAGKATYEWQVGDTDTPGEYAAEIVVYFGAANKPQTAGQFTIRVIDSLHQA